MGLLELLVLVFLLLLLFGALPVYPHSRSWGFAPSGLLTVLLIVLIFFIVF